MNKQKLCALVMAVVVVSTTANAQYKKLSVKEQIKNVRTYGGLTLGSTMHFMGDGKGSPQSYYIELTTINPEARWFTSLRGGVMLPTNFAFGTIGKARFTGSTSISPRTSAFTVSGKTTPIVIGELNFGCFLGSLENSEAFFKPFLTFGFNGQADGGINKNTTNRSENPMVLYDLDKEPSYASIGLGVKGGAGFILRLSNTFSLKVEGGYNLFGNLSYDEDGSGTHISNYHAFTSGPFASAGLNFRLGKGE